MFWHVSRFNGIFKEGIFVRQPGGFFKKKRTNNNLFTEGCVKTTSDVKIIMISFICSDKK